MLRFQITLPGFVVLAQISCFVIANGLLADAVIPVYTFSAKIHECADNGGHAGLNSGYDGPCGDFRGAKLSGRDLSGKNLRGSDFSGADLSDANLSGADLTGVKLLKADVRGANLKDYYSTGMDPVRFDGAIFDQTTIFPWSFDPWNSKTYLRIPRAAASNQMIFVARQSPVFRYDAKRGGCFDASGKAGLNSGFLGECGDLNGVSLDGNSFVRGNFRGASFAEAALEFVDFTGADLTGASFRHASLKQVFFNDAIMFRADLNQADFICHEGSDDARVDFSGADLRSAAFVAFGSFRCTDLTDTNLGAADLHGNWIKGMTFTRTNLANANLDGVDLSYSVLRSVNMSGANLSGSHLVGVDARGTDLRGVNFAGAWTTLLRFDRTTQFSFSFEQAEAMGMVEFDPSMTLGSLSH